MQDTRGRGTVDPHVVICVHPNGETRIAKSTHLDDAFRQWAHRYGIFIPVAAFQCDPAAFCEAAQIPRLPKTATTEWVAEFFHRAPVQLSAQMAVLRHYRRLGPAKTVPLFQEWARAVRGVGA